MVIGTESFSKSLCLFAQTQTSCFMRPYCRILSMLTNFVRFVMDFK